MSGADGDPPVDPPAGAGGGSGKPPGRGRFPKGQSGNPNGRKKGSRNKASIAAEALLDGEAEKIAARIVELVHDRNAPVPLQVQALKLAAERALPVRSGRPVSFDMPPIETAEDAPRAQAAIAAAAASGILTPAEAAEFSRLVSNWTQAFDASELANRVVILEELVSRKRTGEEPDSQPDDGDDE